jgi:hypothetical protein
MAYLTENQNVTMRAVCERVQLNKLRSDVSQSPVRFSRLPHRHLRVHQYGQEPVAEVREFLVLLLVGPWDGFA